MKRLKVYYGFAKINKIFKKRELQIIFENGNNNPEKNERMVRRWMEIAYIREQTKEEERDAEGSTRMFTKYGYFIDDKPFFSDIAKVLEANFQADKNHLSIKTREEIRRTLKIKYCISYNK